MLLEGLRDNDVKIDENPPGGRRIMQPKGYTDTQDLRTYLLPSNLLPLIRSACQLLWRRRGSKRKVRDVSTKSKEKGATQFSLSSVEVVE
ncbi:hypothetical protein QE152_g31221 [Popillia japonica]|uniref:Uncharacterized protein n=1 Tax=Popillia japonica TaxID=7064 RepID=A0AAW1JBS7_POPJA